ncbi:MAG: ribosomal-protein-alanine N-acetyltransferase [Chloroflexi bacterium]|nr:ribosomal-protein-alanine N-acetyltransferase [Chloroflexota bacterium]
MDVALRRMRAEDIPQVIAIEREAFSPGWVGTPFRRDLNSRYCRFLVAYLPDDDDTHSLDDAAQPASGAPDASMWGRMLQGVKSALGLAGEQFNDQLAGYVGIWLQGSQAHITEIAVRESLRGQGIGELLLIGTVRVALEQGMDEVTLEARVSNFIAQRLYHKYGFNEMGIRKNYYADNREDAVIMTTDAIHAGAYREQFTRLQERFLERYGEIHIDL